MADSRSISPKSVDRMKRAVGTMATQATARVEAGHAWYGQLSAEDRSWIGVIAHGGITAFLRWLEKPSLEHAGAIDVFAEAPRELTRSISLEQTLDLLRTVIDVVEDEAPAYASEHERPHVREAVLRYAREVAFGAAHVYARAAESRGAWDARLESLVVDAVVRGEPDESLGSRVNALGWAEVRGVTVIVGSSPSRGEASVVDPLRRAARHAGYELLVSVEGRRMIAVVGGLPEQDAAPLHAAEHLAQHFGDGPVVCGPPVPHLYASGRSAREALRAYEAAPAMPHCPRPCESESLLAARALAGDGKARRALATRVVGALDSGTALGDTARAHVRSGSLEATARELFVHANTVRYRLGRIRDLTGFDLADADDMFALRLSLMLADLEAANGPRRPRSEPSL